MSKTAADYLAEANAVVSRVSAEEAVSGVKKAPLTEVVEHRQYHPVH